MSLMLWWSHDRSHDRHMVDLIPPGEDVSVVDQIDRVLNPVQSFVPRLPNVSNWYIYCMYNAVNAHYKIMYIINCLCHVYTQLWCSKEL